MRAAAVAACIAVALAALPARAAEPEPYRDADHYFEIALGDGWSPTEPGTGPEQLLLARAATGGRALAVARIAYPNPNRRDRDYQKRIEAGVKAAARGYHRLSHKVSRAGYVVVIDLTYRRDTDSGREVVASRFLLFRTFSLVLSVAMPSRTWRHQRRPTQKLVRSFVPYFADGDAG